MRLRAVSWALIGGLMLVAGVAGAGQSEGGRLSVRGEATLQLPADEARLTLAVVTTAAALDDAVEQNGDRMRAVHKALGKAGVAKGELETGRFQVLPEWTPRPREAAPDWRPAIAGYRVVNTLVVRTRQLERVGALIETGLKAGANEVQGVDFGLADPFAHRQGAIAGATVRARRDAEALAAAAGVRLGALLTVQLDDARAELPGPRVMAMAAEGMRRDLAPPLEPGTVTVHAAVTLVYAIAP